MKLYELQSNLIRVCGILIIVLVILLALSPIFAIGYLIFHPELVGQFFGKIVEGFNNPN